MLHDGIEMLNNWFFFFFQVGTTRYVVEAYSKLRGAFGPLLMMDGAHQPSNLKGAEAASWLVPSRDGHKENVNCEAALRNSRQATALLHRCQSSEGLQEVEIQNKNDSRRKKTNCLFACSVICCSGKIKQ